MGKIINIILIVLLGAVMYGAYSLYLDLPLESKDLSIVFKQNLPEARGVSSELVQFSPNMRFSTNYLSYYIQSECSSERKQSSREAFRIISEKVEVLRFYEISVFDENVDILIKCSEESKESISDDSNRQTLIAGEGGPTKFLELEPYSLSIQGEVQLYSSKKITQCDEPLVEIHELLHVLGYNHTNDKTSILYPYLSCDQKIKDNIIEDLQRLYAEPAKSELAIANISASKSGRYLDFYIEIKNTGLIDAEDVKIEIFSEGNEIKTLEMQDVSPGMMRSLEMKNLQLNSNKENQVTFTVKSSTPEYYLENNIVKMVVE